MNKTRWLVIAVAAAISAGGLFVFKTQAAESATPQRPLRGHWLEQAREKLGLTDEQVDLVLATGLRQVHAGGGVEGERITVHRVRIDNLSDFLSLQRGRGIQIDFKVRLAEYMLWLRQQKQCCVR